MIRQPFPCAATGSVRRGIDVDAPLTRFFGYIFTRMVGAAKFPNLLFGEQNFSVFFASVCGAVFNAVHRVFRATGPIQVLPIYAVSIVAFMGRISAILRTFSVDLFTDYSVNAILNPINPDTSVPAVIDGKRPQDAFFRLRSDCGFDEFDRAEVFPIGHLAKHTHCSPTVNGELPCRF